MGGVPYLIPGGGSTVIGSLGYVQCADEIVQQCRACDFEPNHIVVASGSAGTQAGLIAGFASQDCRPCVTGISVGLDRIAQERKVGALLAELSDWLGLRHEESMPAVHVNDAFIGPGYGLPDEAVREAIQLAARTEGLLLDPVYTGKAMAGLIALIREERFKPDEHVVFVHTGGSAALFGYEAFFR
jgi:1-aminocyclopropane-1-carboxylate deaminase/D-cysteine desulfhydrase-like pyridoxal-dependent ACC family enzyme